MQEEITVIGKYFFIFRYTNLVYKTLLFLLFFRFVMQKYFNSFLFFSDQFFFLRLPFLIDRLLNCYQSLLIDVPFSLFFTVCPCLVCPDS